MDPTTKTASEKVVVALAKVVPPTAAFEKLAATVRSHMAEVEELRNRINTLPPQMVELPEAGRRKGPTPETAYLVVALKRRLAAAGRGAEPTPIAVEIFKALGFKGGQLKTKADHLVRAYKKTL